MSGSRFEFNPGWERQVEQMAVNAMKQKMQPMLDRLLGECKGKPVDEVKEILAREWTRTVGGAVTDPELTNYAKALADGVRIVVR